MACINSRHSRLKKKKNNQPLRRQKFFPARRKLQMVRVSSTQDWLAALGIKYHRSNPQRKLLGITVLLKRSQKLRTVFPYRHFPSNNPVLFCNPLWAFKVDKGGEKEAAITNIAIYHPIAQRCTRESYCTRVQRRAERLTH